MTRSTPDERLIQAARDVDVSIAVLAPGLLVRRAIAHYNSRLRPGDRPATTASSPAFLQRLCVNWLRHTGSSYDTHRDQIRAAGGQTLSDSVGVLVKHRVLGEIARCYPWLAEEAARQARVLPLTTHNRKA